MRFVVRLDGCTATPFGSYLKALAVLRLVSEQVDDEARGWWDADTFTIESLLSREELIAFFLQSYSPTPIVAPWNGGSGFYPKDNKEGIDSIAASTGEPFKAYREVILACRAFAPVQQGKVEKDAKAEDERRRRILLLCRSELPDSSVEWLDAALGIAADGSRAFAPVLGTGGNEGRLDYTNNFMSRVSSLLLNSSKTAADLLAHALFGSYASALQGDAAGQYDPGRAGGANQGPGVEAGCVTNPWDFVLTMEGAVAWASGLYRRHGVSYRSFLCSPFTVRATTVGYGSASQEDDARAEIWAPLWLRRARYQEIRILLREGRAAVDGRAAETGLEFAEAATSLGVDRSIDRFVRYSLLKRRGDSYVALPTGIFPARYRSESDRIRELQSVIAEVERWEIPKGSEKLRRRLDSAMYETLLHGGSVRLRTTVAALGRWLRHIVTTSDAFLPPARLDGAAWIAACGTDCVEVRMAGALASLYDPEAGSLRNNLTRGLKKQFAWIGRNLPERLLAVLDLRQRGYSYSEDSRPFDGRIQVNAGDATLFIEGSTDDDLIEDLLFGFTCFRWNAPARLDASAAEVLPVFAALKYSYLPDRVLVNGNEKRLRADPRIPAILRAGDTARAAGIAIDRLRVAGLRPVKGVYHGGIDPQRLGAALLIPMYGLSDAILHEELKNSARA
jgi:CRISPR-associated protein Csx17